MGAMTLTGDPRRWATEPGLVGVVRYPDTHRWGEREPRPVEESLRGLEDVIMYEGPHTIAAIFLETIVGTNGILIPPDGYIQGVRELCDRHGILMVADEVMAGFGRTGKWFAIEHWNTVPDLMTMAKGLTSSYLPLGAVAIRRHIADKFDSMMFDGGLTYSSHPVSLAASLATLNVYEEDHLIERAAAMDSVMRAHHERLAAKHPSVGDASQPRALRHPRPGPAAGALHADDASFNATSEEMAAVGRYLRDHGVYTMVSNNSIHTNPPLCISEEELAHGIRRHRRRTVDRRPGRRRASRTPATTVVSNEDAERARLRDDPAGWRRWGPYLSERAWGTVREDYSANGDAWNYVPHDQARSRAFRWSEEGLGGICDDHQLLCLAFAFWNGVDPILKERIFGLTGPQGNHGEDAKEYWWYVDSTPTHSWMRWRYLYPQVAFPYDDLLAENARRGQLDPEYELADTGVLDSGFWDITVDYAKETPEDLVLELRARNAGASTQTLHVLPTLWFRNTWAWGITDTKPALHVESNADRRRPHGRRPDVPHRRRRLHAARLRQRVQRERLWGSHVAERLPEGRHQRPRDPAARPP